MSRKEGWKTRLLEMQESTKRIITYCSNIKSSEQLASDQKTFDACIRNFQILGDAAKKVPDQIQKSYPSIPWKQIKGMRNIVVHEYFGTSSSIVWKTVDKHLPQVLKELILINNQLASPSHEWKICPPGETYIRTSHIDAYFRDGKPVREHLRTDHCRELSSSSKSILTIKEIEDISKMYFEKLKGNPTPNDLGYKNTGNQFDSFIRGWTTYWNDVFKPNPPLEANIVKALIASESGFNSNAGINKKGAKGLLQLMPETLQYLRGEKNELKDHLFEFNTKEALDPNLNIAAGIRWLFRKRETASARLGRQATWEESVSEYKDYLRRKIKNPKTKTKGLDTYGAFLNILNNENKK